MTTYTTTIATHDRTSEDFYPHDTAVFIRNEAPRDGIHDPIHVHSIYLGVTPEDLQTDIDEDEAPETITQFVTRDGHQAIAVWYDVHPVGCWMVQVSA